jgi:hypothetical protein
VRKQDNLCAQKWVGVLSRKGYSFFQMKDRERTKAMHATTGFGRVPSSKGAAVQMPSVVLPLVYGRRSVPVCFVETA